MMLKADIYNNLRAAALKNFPDKCKIYYKEHQRFPDWLLSGSYVPNIIGSVVNIEAFIDEIAAAQLTEIELYINNCYEHIQENVKYSADTETRSNAWFVVTQYYFALYCAQVYLSLLGQPVYFISETYKNILSKKGLNLLGTGTYKLNKKCDLSITKAQYVLTKTKHNFHEQIWLDLMNSIEHYIKTYGTNDDEKIFYTNITCSCLNQLYGNHIWPSALRNKINYIPGLMYCLVEGKTDASFKKHIEKWCCTADATSIFYSTIRALERNPKDISKQVELLYDLSHSLFLLSKTLYNDISSRKNFDCRMENKRRTYIKGIYRSKYKDFYIFNNKII